jgi:hypothetical protein
LSFKKSPKEAGKSLEKKSENEIIRSGIRVLRDRDIKLKKKYDISGRLIPWDIEDMIFRNPDVKGAYFVESKFTESNIFVSIDPKEKKEKYINYSFDDLMKMQFMPEELLRCTIITQEVFPGTRVVYSDPEHSYPSIYCETMNKVIVEVFNIIKVEGVRDIFPKMFEAIGGDSCDPSKDKLSFRIKYLSDLVSEYKANKLKYRPYLKKCGLVS